MSLVEVMVASLLALILLGSLWLLFSSSMRRSTETSEELFLVTEARILAQKLAHDINAAYIFLPPGSGEDAETTITLARFDRWDIDERIDKNVTQQHRMEYPFAQNGGRSTTVQEIPVSEVRYRYDPAGSTVSRRERSGLLQLSTTTNKFRLDRYEFLPGRNQANLPERIIARNVRRFSLVYAGYNRPGGMKIFTPDQRHRASCLGLDYRSSYSVEGTRENRVTPVMELTTKFWIMRKLRERQYPEYHSSADEDLRY